MKIVVLLVIAVLHLSVSRTQLLTPLTAAQIKLLDSIATQDVPAGAPGIATCIIHRGKLVYEKYAGYANLDDSSLITRNTRFNMASNGKQFTAIAILQLIEQGKLRLDDDVRAFLPDLFRNLVHKLTIQHLLTHTSGIRDVYDLWSLQGITWWKQRFDNKDACALLARQRELNFVPGKNYLYSNSNYILLAQITELVSGKPFEAYTGELFQQLGMRATSFEPDHQRIKGPIAQPYFNFSTWTRTEWTWNVQGDGNLFSTMADQVRWEQLLQQQQGAPLSKLLLNKSQNRINAATNNYGYGLEFGTYRKKPYTFHEGATGAWKSTVLRFPQEQVSIITFTNSGKTIPSMQTRQMADVLFGWQAKTEEFLTVPPKTGNAVTLEEVAGIYQTPSGFTFQFEKRDSALFLLRSGRNDIRLVRESANIFHQWNDPAFKQEFTKNAAGEMQVTAYHTTHAPYSLTRAAVNWEGFSFQSIEGTFTNEETGVSMTVLYKGNKTYEIEMAKNKRTAILISPTQILMDNYQITVRNLPGNNVPTLFLNGGRIREVRFSR